MKIKSIIVLCMLFVGAVGINAQSYQLRYKLKNGQEYRFYQETKMNITQSLGIIEQEIKNEFKGITRFIPIGKEGENIILNASFETMIIHIESMMFNINYDSSKPVQANDKVANIYNGVIGKDFKMVITPQGEVIRIDGIDKLINDAVNNMGDLQPQVASQMRKTLSGHFGEEALSGNMAMLLSMYPSENKKVGDTWSMNTKLTSALKATLNNEWTLADAANNQWKLKGNGRITTLGEESEMNGMKMSFNLKGNQDSEFIVNQEDGWFVSGKQSQHIEGTISMKGNSQMPQGMEVPMKVVSSTYLEKR
ncbi:DUF6263 family protein [Saccharicrinis fermentans]|uniref:Uncharacterized protein n=1 Tax=Saccharicrinis fermentans DSM 9555 = JCM 21142 TaxID=869213 RepID=W7XXM5_9BACT|nr:DUF6263 family protein [Saccharicrinis fermentans]GAF03200.1 hypothetical protein JCM21142_41865 [Saccharicrinis fermentans DSM 9555 = JCM 21142]